MRTQSGTYPKSVAPHNYNGQYPLQKRPFRLNRNMISIFKKRKPVIAFKFYSIGSNQDGIDREKFVLSLLDAFETQLNELPHDYDIHGPYGIAKGRSVGIKAFKNKLQLKGHSKYSALSGTTDSRLGFEVRFHFKVGEISYSEIVIWYNPLYFAPTFSEIAELINRSFPISCAYEIEIDLERMTVFENPMKRGWLGGLSIKMAYEHLQWIKDFQNGAYRGIYKKNLFSDLQLNLIRKDNPTLVSVKVCGLNHVEENLKTDG